MNPINAEQTEDKAIDYSEFGGTPIEEESPQVDYSQFGGTPVDDKPEKEKVGKGGSFLYGLAEGVLGIPALVSYGLNEYNKGLEKAFYGEATEQSFEEENPILNFMMTFPESEDETSRRIRAGTAGVVTGIPFGIPGIIAGLIGSQAGQTVREIFGKDGKFDEFGWGEASAIGADVLTGGFAGIGASLARSGVRTAAQQAPSIFRSAETGLQRSVTKNAIQGEKAALQGIVDNFGRSQIREFEQQAATISPVAYTDLTQSNASALQRNADRMFRQGQLSIISPLEVTPEQGGRAIQEAANATFHSNVITAEREAYSVAEQAAKNITGTAPKTVQEAKTLLGELLATPPTPEQEQMVGFLRTLITELETTTPASTIAASSLLDSSGRPLTPAIEVPASSQATTRPANDLVGLVQKANQAVNYGSDFREQSHRLIPVVNTLRQETGAVLRKNPAASAAYQAANNLHATNAETWGTKYMRNVRFSENPETIVGQTQRASNMRNLKEAVPDAGIQGVAERLVIEKITEGGSAQANRNAVSKLAPELSTNARNAGEQLINVKDPLTTSGGRAVVRNQILKDAAQAVNTGKRPEVILDLMQTPKGYNIVRESLSGTHPSRELFQSFQRLFVEDVFNAAKNPSGQIDFSKAKNIIKNDDVRQVIQTIGGDSLVNRFAQLETAATNFERNMNLFKSPEAQSLFKSIMKETKQAGVVGLVLHSLHVPVEVIATLGLGKALLGATKATYNVLANKVLSNPRAVQILESISRANSTQELSKQLPRLLIEIEKIDSQ